LFEGRRYRSAKLLTVRFMPDQFSRKKRSEIMSRIKSAGNRTTELRLIEVFKGFGIKGWRRGSKLFGRPDFVFNASRVAVFVDGCFWHSCPIHGQVPVQNREFWQQKLERNRIRDRRVRSQLRRSDWAVVRVWQHELRTPERVIGKLKRYL
jgi:DNA mismatch endonuclease (patch repair protein)